MAERQKLSKKEEEYGGIRIQVNSTIPIESPITKIPNELAICNRSLPLAKVVGSHRRY